MVDCQLKIQLKLYILLIFYYLVLIQIKVLLNFVNTLTIAPLNIPMVISIGVMILMRLYTSMILPFPCSRFSIT